VDENRKYNIQLRDVVDKQKFNGNLLSVATSCHDEEKCIAMMTYLI
jgi:hypothetical protein